MKQLQRRSHIAAPQMLPLLDSKKEELNQVKQRLKDKVRDQFKSIRMGAQKVHRSVNKSVADKWKPAFRRAKKETGMYHPTNHATLSYDTANGIIQGRECISGSDRCSMPTQSTEGPTCSRIRRTRSGSA